MPVPGKKLLSVLSHAGIECKYLLLPSIGSVITEVSTVIVGAHSIHTNGAVYSRAGTALVAMMAKQHSVPFIVCCETYKFSEGVQLDSFTKNELCRSHIFVVLELSSHGVSSTRRPDRCISPDETSRVPYLGKQPTPRNPQPAL